MSEDTTNTEEIDDTDEELAPGTYYNLISPDGLPSWPEPFTSLIELAKGAAAFVERYRHQGYYKTMRMEQIPLDKLLDYCEVEKIVVHDPEGEWKKIGAVGVDSGQLMVCDPCYLSRWKDDHPSGPEGNLGYKHEDGTILYCKLHGPCLAEGAIGFFNFDTVIPKYGKTANQLQKEGVIKKVERRPSGKFTYSGACQATGSEEQAGELENGTGVAFSSGLGDGHYEVFARYQDCGDWGRRVAEVKIVMIDEDD